MRTAPALALLLLPILCASGLPAQTSCQFAFVSDASTSTAAGSGATVLTQTVQNQNPAATGCPAVVEPAPQWIRLVHQRAAAAAGTEFGYRVFENFESTARKATLRVHGATHQIQQSAGPNQGRVPRMAVRAGDGSVRLYPFAGAVASVASGLAAASPPALYQGTGCNAELVVRDTQNRLAANSFNGCTGQWLGWRNLGGTIAGRPALTQQPGGSMIAAVRDSFGGYSIRRFPAGQSTGDWIALGGVFTTDPAIASDASGQVYLAARDLWNALWVGRMNALGQFLGWTFAGGIVRGQPSLAAGADGVIYIATRDPWNGLNLLRVKDASILGWSRGGGALSADPTVSVPGDGSVYVAALAADGALHYRTFAEGSTEGWGPWLSAGGQGRHAASAAIGGEALFAVVDPWNTLLWFRPATGEWRSFGVQAAGAGPPAASP